MLYEKEEHKACVYCLYGNLYDDNTVLCNLKGPVTLDFCCRRFRYDPLLRAPAQKPRIRHVPDDAFEL